MKERLLQSFAILLAGLFSAERPRAWQLGDTTPRRREVVPPRKIDAADPAASLERSKN